MRQLRLRMPDDSIRSITVDENQPVANLMVLICTKLGITNHDEYSLIATGAHNTINGRRKERNDGRIIDQKMEQLKKKLKTDEDLAWLDHSKTLDEQEVHEQDVVVLRRRFFYSDQNVDSRDPIQLGVLYVQTRDAILSGTHPVTLDGACKFAGLQCQAQLGDFVEGKTTRPGYFNLKDYLPADYSKCKNIERRVHQEHKKHYGVGELEAKSRYVGEARSLPTYGVTFFLVKEKVAGKNKLVPRLLGITKESVMRVDADTKGILKIWPLTTVKRWAASMNSFTLDFGDYSDSYYSVQTSEGEQISQLIAGYIDIILRRRKAKDHFGIEGDEGATMIEDSVAPSRATIIQNQGTLARPPPPVTAAPSTQDLASVPGPEVQRTKLEQGPYVEPPEFKPAFEVRGKAEIGYEAGPITQYVTNYELSLPQRDLQDRLEQAQDAIEEAQKVLDKPLSAADAARHPQQQGAANLEAKKRELSSQFAGMNAATAQLVSLSAVPEEELNYPALNKAVETVATGLPSLTKDIKLVAAQMHDDRLVEAARRLCKAFSDLLNAAEPGPTVPRSSLISAASRVADETQTLLYTINEQRERSASGAYDEVGADADEHRLQREQADQLLSLAKTVASSAANLVVKTKDVASMCRDEELQNTVIGSATQCALATSQMVATAKIVAPTIHDAQCQRKLVDSCREVQRAVHSIEGSCERAVPPGDERLHDELQDIVGRVQRALDKLMDHVNSIRYHHYNRSLTRSTTTTTTSTSRHHKQHAHNHTQHNHDAELEEPHSSSNSELVNQARHLAKATEKLILDIRPEQRESPSNPNSNGNYNSNTNSGAKTTTITTTLYDERGQPQRPASYYDSETATPLRPSEATSHAYELLERTRCLDPTSSVPLSDTRHQQQTTVTTHTTTTVNHQQNGASEEQPQQPEAAISGIVGDLETTIMFASAGTLRAHDEHDSYLYHRENVLRCAKALVEDSRPLVASSASSDAAQLAHAVQESVITMSRLADTVKSSAASLGPNQVDSQISLIKSVKEVAVSLADLIASTKHHAGTHDARLYQVKDSAKSMVNSVTSLLHTVKSVEEEQQRGLRAIEATIEALEFELANLGGNLSILDNNNHVLSASQASGLDKSASSSMTCRQLGDELARLCRPVTMATTKTIHAGSSGAQDDAIVAANMSRKALTDLLQLTKSSLHIIESYELKLRCHEAAKLCAHNYKHLLELLHKIFLHPSIASANPEVKQDLIGQSKLIASNVSELCQCAELVKASQANGDHHQHQQQQVSSSTVTTTTTLTSTSLSKESNKLDYSNPNVIAESELLGAASSIDAAAKKLENLKPRVTSVKLPHEELNFDEIILEAAKSIIEATAALLRAASASQRELRSDGRLDDTETFYASDTNQWSEGLVSAARMVAAATHSLVEAANALVQGQASEERLISAAKQVASSTNQLLVACKVKAADPDSRTITRLSNAGQHVKRATDNLVRAAQQAIEHDDEQSLVISNRKVSGIAQEISAREQILRKEKELQVAKTQLMAIRKAKYSNRPDDYQGYGGSLA